MKKYLIIILTLVTLVGTFVPASFVLAQTPAPTATANTPVQPQTPQVQQTEKSVADVAANAMKDMMSSFQSFNPFKFSKILQDWALNTILSFFAFLMTLAGGLLDMVIWVTILNMRGFVTSVPSITLVADVFRDFMGMFFIFILIRSAFMMILGVGKEKGPDWKSLLTRIVVVMILINFSPLFTKLMIDASNLVAITFYRQIPGISLSDLGNSMAVDVGQQDSLGWKDKEGLSASLVGALKISSIYKADISPKAQQELQNMGVAEALLKKSAVSSIEDSATTISLIMSSIVIIIVTVVLLTACAILIWRFFILLILLMTSPVMFIGMIAPEIDEFAEWQKKWWSALKSELFYAPAFMFMLWVALTIVTSQGFKSTINIDGLAWADLFIAPIGVQMKIVINFIIVIGFLLAAVIAPKKFGAGGSGIGSLANKMAIGTLGGAAGAAYGYVGNQTIGKFLSGISGKVEETRFAKTSRLGATVSAGLKDFAKTTKFNGQNFDEYNKEEKGYEKAGKEFDKRANLLSTVTSAAGVLGAAGSSDTDRRKATNDIIEKVKKMSGKDLVGLGKDGDSYIALKPEVFAQLTDTQIDGMLSAMESDGDKAKVNEARVFEITSKFGDDGKIIDEAGLKAALKNASSKTIASLDVGTLTNKNLLKSLSDKQFKAVMEGGLPQKIKNEIETKRYQDLIGMVQDTTKKATAAEIKAELANFSADEIARLTPESFKVGGKIDERFISVIGSKLLNSIAKEGKYDQSDLDQIVNGIEDNYTTAGTTVSAENDDAVRWLSTSPQARNYFA